MTDRKIYERALTGYDKVKAMNLFFYYNYLISTPLSVETQAANRCVYIISNPTWKNSVEFSGLVLFLNRIK